LIKWIHAYWLVILVSCVIAIGINQLLFTWRDERRRSHEEHDRRDRVSRELLADLRPHCESLQQILLNPAIDLDHWQRVNDGLQDRARENDVALALGPNYHPYLNALAIEARAILALRRGSHDAAATVESVADALVAYAPFVRTFGDAKAAREFESAARQSYDYAKTLR